MGSHFPLGHPSSHCSKLSTLPFKFSKHALPSCLFSFNQTCTLLYFFYLLFLSPIHLLQQNVFSSVVNRTSSGQQPWPTPPSLTPPPPTANHHRAPPRPVPFLSVPSLALLCNRLSSSSINGSHNLPSHFFSFKASKSIPFDALRPH